MADVSVEFGANVGPLTGGMAEASAVVGSTTAEMGAEFETLGARATAGMEKMAASVKGSIESSLAPITAMRAAISSLSEAFLIGFGVEMFAHFIEGAAEAGERMVRLSQVTGIAVESLSQLKFASEQSGVGFDSLAVGLRRLAVNTESAQSGTGKAAAAFHALGITTEEVRAHSNDLFGLLGLIADGMAKHADGAGKSAAATALLGRAGAELIPLLDGGSAGLQAMAEEANRLGITMTGGTAEGLKKVREESLRLGAQWEALKNTLVVDFGPEIERTIKDFGDMVKSIKDVVDWLNKLQNTFNQAKNGGWNIGRDVIGGPGPGGASGKPPVDMGGAATGGPSQVEQWRAQLQQMEEASGNFYKSNLAAELAFWQEKLAQVAKGSKSYIEIEGLIFQAEKGLAQQSLALKVADIHIQEAEDAKDLARKKTDALKLLELMQTTYGQDSIQYKNAMVAKIAADQAWEDQWKARRARREDEDAAAATFAVQMEKSKLDGMKQLGTISEADYVARLKRLEQEQYQSDLRALQQKRLIYQRELAERQKIDDQLLALERRHELQVRQLEQQAAQAVKTQWTNILSPITSAIQSSVTGIAQGTQTAMQAIANLANAVLGEVVNLAVDALEKWVIQLIIGKTTAGAASAAQALGEVANSAAAAGAAAYAATAGIPIVGPELAPAAAATAYAGALAFGAGITPFAEGAWSLPGDMLGMLHKGEAVVPESFAAGMRNEGGGGGRGGDVHFHVSTPDAKGVETFFRIHGGLIAKSLRNQARSFNPNLQPR